jgi:guanyl-specific ribonuclease Sa
MPRAAPKLETSSALSARKGPSAQTASASHRQGGPDPRLLGAAVARDPDIESPALRQQISAVVTSLNETGSPPQNVRRGGLPGKLGVYGNRSGALPAQPEGYYQESDVWPGPGKRGAERIVVGGAGEVWYSPDHYGTFLEWPS